jgi:hypothetical protein
VVEAVGQMTITREAAAISSGRFRRGDDKPPRRAWIRGPKPFAGTARYGKSRRGERSWRGSLRVALPGMGTARLTGPGFRPRLCPRLFLFEACKLWLPPREHAPGRLAELRADLAQISGSQSQDLALDRLSWSR